MLRLEPSDDIHRSKPAFQISPMMLIHKSLTASSLKSFVYVMDLSEQYETFAFLQQLFHLFLSEY